MEQKKSYGKAVLDLDKIDSPEIKINPDLYMHLAIVNVLDSTKGVSPQEGYTRFWVAIEMLESVVRSSQRIPNDYDEQLSKLKQSDEYARATEVRQRQLINITKFKLLLGTAFSMQPLTQELSLATNPTVTNDKPFKEKE